MDLTFKTENGIFNCRVCAIILHNNALLATKNENAPYYYLPGGRVQLHETMDAAIRREVQEELGVCANVVRPLWLNQSFFTEDVTGEQFHEICMYYLVDISRTELLSFGKSFYRTEGSKCYLYEWIPLKTLKDQYLYPAFIKDRIYDLPEALTMLTEYQ